MAERFCVSSTQAIAETIEGEAIIIHLGTGVYYSLREAGADIWSAIEHEATRVEIVAYLQASYEGSPAEVDAEVGRLIEELQAEGLIEEAADGTSSRPLPTATTASRRPFSPPVLEKHTDMQDLILIDPVHEVQARGWPYAEADSGR